MSDASSVGVETLIGEGKTLPGFFAFSTDATRTTQTLTTRFRTDKLSSPQGFITTLAQLLDRLKVQKFGQIKIVLDSDILSITCSVTEKTGSDQPIQPVIDLFKAAFDILDMKVLHSWVIVLVQS